MAAAAHITALDRALVHAGEPITLRKYTGPTSAPTSTWTDTPVRAKSIPANTEELVAGINMTGRRLILSPPRPPGAQAREGGLTMAENPDAPPRNLTFGTVIKLKHSGRMAVFDADGRLIDWTSDLSRASSFACEADAVAGIQAICAPELRAAIRAGYAAVARAVDEQGEETGELFIVDASDRFELYPTPRIRPDVGPRFLTDDPLQQVVSPPDRESSSRVRELVRSIFADAALLNWKLQSQPRISLAALSRDEYRAPASARARRPGSLGKYKGPAERGRRMLAHFPAA